MDRYGATVTSRSSTVHAFKSHRRASRLVEPSQPLAIVTSLGVCPTTHPAIPHVCVCARIFTLGISPYSAVAIALGGRCRLHPTQQSTCTA